MSYNDVVGVVYLCTGANFQMSIRNEIGVVGLVFMIDYGAFFNFVCQ